MKSKSCIGYCLLFLSVFALTATAQIRPVYDQGALGLGQLLKRLNTSGSVMMIGAHPDDEDTALLTYLARGENARTAYLSLTRGDGGQNIIGSETGETLGVIRTEELLQARKLDGAEQYFTRAYDYGFSKTLDEAKQKWDENIVLCDVVQAIRTFRPLVVISRFSGTAADGHGQHQYAGYISPLAVKAAADGRQCRQAGMPWTVKKFYISQGFRQTGEAGLKINTGKYDPLLGRSYFEIAMEARSQHRSQEQGVQELKGDQFSSMNLVGGSGKESGIFDGTDVSVKAAAANTDNQEAQFVKKLQSMQDLSARVLKDYDVRSPEKLVVALAEGYKLAQAAEMATTNPASKAVMRQKQKEFGEALKLAAGIQIDAIAERETVVPGENVRVVTRVFYPASDLITVKEAQIRSPKGWTITAAEEPAAQPQGFFRRESGQYSKYFDLKPGADEQPTQPYWLKTPRKGDLFTIDSGDDVTLPFGPPVASAEIKLQVNGIEIVFTQPVEYRYADDVRGEVRRDLNVVPPLAIKLDHNLPIIRTNAKSRDLSVLMSVSNNSVISKSGKANLSNDPDAVKLSSNPETFESIKPNSTSAIRFALKIPVGLAAGNYEVKGSADSVSKEVRVIRYDHIRTHRIYANAATTLRVMDIKVEPVKVGYINGSGDQVPAAIGQMGLDVQMIGEKELSAGDLSKFDVIAVGIRASQVRPDFAANNQRLLDFVTNGGTLIVQYQRPDYAQQNLMPYPAQMGPRVADENAKVTILKPEHPLFNFPNRITDEDFNGWVQERNLYNFSVMDEKYTGLLESHDAGEAENKGGLVIADIGKGKYVYCSYSMFRQLPAGVPGAFRLFANMLSLPKVKK